MNFKHLVLIIILIQLISAKKKDSAEKCTTCDNLISNFADVKFEMKLNNKNTQLFIFF